MKKNNPKAVDLMRFAVVLAAAWLLFAMPSWAGSASQTGGVAADARIELADSAQDRALLRLCLADLEKQMRTAPEVLIAAAELEESISLLDNQQARSGLELRGDARAGHFQEVTTDDSSRDYNEIALGAGLRYPLLGRYERQKIGVLKAEARVWEKRQQVELARRRSLALLRTHYVNYWGSQQKLALGRTFLAKEKQIEKVFRRRVEAGRLLDADWQEFKTAFARVRRAMAKMKAIGQRALRVMRLLTRADPGPFKAQAPRLPAVCRDMKKLRAEVLDDYPEIRIYRQRVDEQLGILEMTRFGDLDAHVDLGGYVSREDTAQDNGYGVALSVTVRLPAQIRRANQARKKTSLAALKKAQYALELRSSEILADAEEALNRFQADNQNLEFARQRLKAAAERMRENLLRMEGLPGDTLEQFEKSRYQYYLGAVDYIDAQILKFQRQAKLLQYSPAGCAQIVTRQDNRRLPPDTVINENYLQPLWLQKMPALGVSDPGTRSHPRRTAGVKNSGCGAYVWDSARLLENWTTDAFFWQRLAEDGIDRLLVSFDRRQLKAFGTRRSRNRLVDFIAQATQNHVRVELLLGEPLWILPRHRQDLLQIIQQLAQLPFAAVHLDLEPNQLSEQNYSEDYLLAQLLRTMQAVKSLSPWPVGLSMHPRYLDEKRTGLCMGCALTNLGVQQVALMIYVTNAQRTAAIARDIMERYPQLNFAVAQSVEPYLKPEQSYAAAGRFKFRQKMLALQTDIGRDNFGGILIQSWKDFIAMRP